MLLGFENVIDNGGSYDGKVTVPMLWDVERKEGVCNESSDIIHLFNSWFNRFADNPALDLAPVQLKHNIDEWNQVIYAYVNNGVYRKLIAVQPPRSKTQNAITKLEKEIAALEAENTSGSRLLELRKKQFALLLHVVDELQATIEDEHKSLVEEMRMSNAEEHKSIAKDTNSSGETMAID